MLPSVTPPSCAVRMRCGGEVGGGVGGQFHPGFAELHAKAPRRVGHAKIKAQSQRQLVQREAAADRAGGGGIGQRFGFGRLGHLGAGLHADAQRGAEDLRRPAQRGRAVGRVHAGFAGLHGEVQRIDCQIRKFCHWLASTSSRRSAMRVSDSGAPGNKPPSKVQLLWPWARSPRADTVSVGYKPLLAARSSNWIRRRCRPTH